ncbi:hypothetical protein SO802_006150 [Lithocarpus litseifolius]|uniref:Uncharacterized protein n=1 Tax=Lithocarpus litseifolius TaxID=425828 RepID=A0AAW2DMM1_9ROSI
MKEQIWARMQGWKAKLLSQAKKEVMIKAAWEVIEKGAIWWVGSGQQIEVWKHRWLPDPCYNKIISPRADSTVSRVCDLFCTNTKTWDTGKLAATFYPGEAEIVSRVHISAACDEDLLVWPFTIDASYSVRSAYRLLALEEEYQSEFIHNNRAEVHVEETLENSVPQ